ncbi:MAG: leucine-rich repeat domain-containing protein, partial [Alphaproteobacteria bacterium]|nr:leucine-rich repeat domain-containing protein [Alphaproteobacteria bacterium]
MKKNLFTTIIMSLIAIISMAQATSLTIDCQTPGWLSSMINYGDQVTLESLKVTGYINETDLSFIGSLNKNQQLRVIDLEDVQIVAENSSDNNKLTKGYFGGHIQHLILPKSLISASKCLSGATLDTLTIGGESLPVITNSMFYSAVYSGGDGVRFNTHVKHLILREGVKRISDFAFYNELYNAHGAQEEDCVFQSIDMPNTITYIGNYAFHCNYALKKIDIPNKVDTIGDLAFYDTKYLPDTLFLPDSLKHYYTTAFPKKTNQVIYIPEKVNKITN